MGTKISWMDGRHSSVVSSEPTILRPGFKSHVNHQRFWNCNCFAMRKEGRECRIKNISWVSCFTTTPHGCHQVEIHLLNYIKLARFTLPKTCLCHWPIFRYKKKKKLFLAVFYLKWNQNNLWVTFFQQMIIFAFSQHTKNVLQ